MLDMCVHNLLAAQMLFSGEDRSPRPGTWTFNVPMWCRDAKHEGLWYIKTWITFFTLFLFVLHCVFCLSWIGAAASGGVVASQTDELTFLRGMVLTNSVGLATFKTIFPGRYTGRSPHIHAKVSLTQCQGNFIHVLCPSLCQVVLSLWQGIAVDDKYVRYWLDAT